MLNSSFSVPVWLLLGCILVFMIQPSLLCIETAIVRNKNVIHSSIKKFFMFSISFMTFIFIGSVISYFKYPINLDDYFLFYGENSDPRSFLSFLYHALICGTLATIVSGAVVERMKMPICLLIAVVIGVGIYPIIGRWVWSEGGWLSLVGAYDLGGATVIHASAGWVALAAILFTGPRHKFFRSDMFTKQFQNFPLAIFGLFVVWICWPGFAIGTLSTFDQKVALIVTNIYIAAIGGACVSIFIAIIRPAYFSPILVLHGPIAGLVAISASADHVSPVMALVVGLMGGGGALLGAKIMKWLRLDDGIGVIGPHLIAGSLGALVAPFVSGEAHYPVVGGFVPFLKGQVILVVAVGAWSFSLTYAVLYVASRFIPIRISRRDEVMGLNISEYGVTTELAAQQKQMLAQIRAIDLTGVLETNYDSEIGVLINYHNRAISTFEAKYDAWLNDMTRQDTSGDVLKQRNDILEEELVNRRAELKENNEKIKAVGHLIQNLVDANGVENRKYLQLLRRTTSMCSKSLKEIFDITNHEDLWGAPHVAANYLRSVVEQNRIVLMRLNSLKMIIDLQEVESITSRKPLNIRKSINTALNRYRAKKPDVRVNCDIASNLPLLACDPNMLDGAIHILIDVALRRARHEFFLICDHQEGGVILSVRDDGPHYPNMILRSLEDPFNAVVDGQDDDLSSFDLDLSVISRVSSVHNAELTVSNLNPKGVFFSLYFPQLHVLSPGDSSLEDDSTDSNIDPEKTNQVEPLAS